jgi:hypothetical protein
MLTPLFGELLPRKIYTGVKVHPKYARTNGSSEVAENVQFVGMA